MAIGLGVILIIAGLVLAFDVVTIDIANVNDNTLGWILLAGGVIAIAVSLAATRRHTIVEERPVDVERRIR